MPEKYPIKFPILHLHSPEAHHGEQVMVCNRAGLEQVKKSIEYALAGLDESGNTLGVQRIFSTSDGEGFDLFILIAPDNEIDDYPLPYTADWIADVQDYSKLTERLKAFYEAMKEKNE